MIYGVILAGGKGERLWPLSRSSRPKQLIKLGQRTLLEEAYFRLSQIADEVWIITSKDLEGPVSSFLPDANIIAEPVSKNTAPACVYATALALARDPKALLVVAPSDHLIKDTTSFLACTRVALDIASQGYLVTFGVVPTYPATGYGYIERGDLLADCNGIHVFRIERFHEKPDEQTARQYIETKKFFWNSGMFVWPAQLFLNEAVTFVPQFARCLEKGLDVETFYKEAPTISVDYAVMEHTRRAAVVKATFDWEDIGSLAALDKIFGLTSNFNTVWGKIVQYDCENCVLVAEEGAVAAIGLRNLVVVRTGDVTLVIPRDQVHRVRELLAKIKEDSKFRHLL